MNSGLKRGIGRLCSGLGIPLFGCAPAERWEIPHFEPWVPEKFYPASIVPEIKNRDCYRHAGQPAGCGDVAIDLVP